MRTVSFKMSLSVLLALSTTVGGSALAASEPGVVGSAVVPPPVETAANLAPVATSTPAPQPNIVRELPPAAQAPVVASAPAVFAPAAPTPLPTPSVSTVPVRVVYVSENQPVQIVDSQGRLLQVIYLKRK